MTLNPYFDQTKDIIQRYKVIQQLRNDKYSLQNCILKTQNYRRKQDQLRKAASLFKQSEKMFCIFFLT